MSKDSPTPETNLSTADAALSFIGQPFGSLQKLDRMVFKIYRSSNFEIPNILKDTTEIFKNADKKAIWYASQYCELNSLFSLSFALGQIYLQRDNERPNPRRVLRQASLLDAMGFFDGALHLIQAAYQRHRASEYEAWLAHDFLKKGELEAAQEWGNRLLESNTRLSIAYNTAAARQSAIQQCRSSRQGLPFDTFVINLEQDFYRRKAIEEHMNRLNLLWNLVKAFRIDSIDQKFQYLFRLPVSDIVDGSYGNQLTQYLVWKKIASGKHNGAALILEDDTRLSSSIVDPRDWPLCPARFDIIFVNSRMAQMDQHTSNFPGPQFVPISRRMQDLSNIKPDLTAPGADGYVLSTAGAKKLVDIVELEGFHSVGTDWYLLSHCVTKSDISKLNTKSVSHRKLTGHLNSYWHSPTILEGFVQIPHIVQHMGIGIKRDTRSF